MDNEDLQLPSSMSPEPTLDLNRTTETFFDSSGLSDYLLDINSGLTYKVVDLSSLKLLLNIHEQDSGHTLDGSWNTAGPSNLLLEDGHHQGTSSTSYKHQDILNSLPTDLNFVDLTKPETEALQHGEDEQVNKDLDEIISFVKDNIYEDQANYCSQNQMQQDYSNLLFEGSENQVFQHPPTGEIFEQETNPDFKSSTSEDFTQNTNNDFFQHSSNSMFEHNASFEHDTRHLFDEKNKMFHHDSRKVFEHNANEVFLQRTNQLFVENTNEMFVDSNGLLNSTKNLFLNEEQLQDFSNDTMEFQYKLVNEIEKQLNSSSSQISNKLNSLQSMADEMYLGDVNNSQTQADVNNSQVQGSNARGDVNSDQIQGSHTRRQHDVNQITTKLHYYKTHQLKQINETNVYAENCETEQLHGKRLEQQEVDKTQYEDVNTMSYPSYITHIDETDTHTVSATNRNLEISHQPSNSNTYLNNISTNSHDYKNQCDYNENKEKNTQLITIGNQQFPTGNEVNQQFSTGNEVNQQFSTSEQQIQEIYISNEQISEISNNFQSLNENFNRIDLESNGKTMNTDKGINETYVKHTMESSAPLYITHVTQSDEVRNFKENITKIDQKKNEKPTPELNSSKQNINTSDLPIFIINHANYNTEKESETLVNVLNENAYQVDKNVKSTPLKNKKIHLQRIKNKPPPLHIPSVDQVNAVRKNTNIAQQESIEKQFKINPKSISTISFIPNVNQSNDTVSNDKTLVNVLSQSTHANIQQRTNEQADNKIKKPKRTKDELSHIFIPSNVNSNTKRSGKNANPINNKPIKLDSNEQKNKNTALKKGQSSCLSFILNTDQPNAVYNDGTIEGNFNKNEKRNIALESDTYNETYTKHSTPNLSSIDVTNVNQLNEPNKDLKKSFHNEPLGHNASDISNENIHRESGKQPVNKINVQIIDNKIHITYVNESNEDQPNVDQLIVNQSHIEQSNLVHQLNVNQPSTDQLIVNQSNVNQPNVDQLIVNQSHIEQSNLVHQLNVNQPSTDQLIANQSNVNLPNIDQQIINQSNCTQNEKSIRTSYFQQSGNDEASLMTPDSHPIYNTDKQQSNDKINENLNLYMNESQFESNEIQPKQLYIATVIIKPNEASKNFNGYNAGINVNQLLQKHLHTILEPVSKRSKVNSIALIGTKILPFDEDDEDESEHKEINHENSNDSELTKSNHLTESTLEGASSSCMMTDLSNTEVVSSDEVHYDECDLSIDSPEHLNISELSIDSSQNIDISELSMDPSSLNINSTKNVMIHSTHHKETQSSEDLNTCELNIDSSENLGTYSSQSSIKSPKEPSHLTHSSNLMNDSVEVCDLNDDSIKYITCNVIDSSNNIKTCNLILQSSNLINESTQVIDSSHILLQSSKEIDSSYLNVDSSTIMIDSSNNKLYSDQTIDSSNLEIYSSQNMKPKIIILESPHLLNELYKIESSNLMNELYTIEPANLINESHEIESSNLLNKSYNIESSNLINESHKIETSTERNLLNEPPKIESSVEQIDSIERSLLNESQKNESSNLLNDSHKIDLSQLSNGSHNIETSNLINKAHKIESSIEKIESIERNLLDESHKIESSILLNDSHKFDSCKLITETSMCEDLSIDSSDEAFDSCDLIVDSDLSSEFDLNIELENNTNWGNVLDTISDNISVEERERIFQTMVDKIRKRKKPDYNNKLIFESEKDKLSVYICNMCGQIFEQITNYYGHLRKHTNEFVWKCTDCPDEPPTIFRTQSLLKQHIRQNHSTERNFVCELCDATFIYASQLFTHLNVIHKSEREFECTICAARFYKKSDLRNHIQIHLKIKSHLCHICGKTFSQYSNLIAHKRSHTGSRPYPCVYCGKRFKQINALNIHKRTHTNVGKQDADAEAEEECENEGDSTECKKEDTTKRPKKYYCLVCGETFRYQVLLRQHIATLHEKQKLFECSECVQVYHNVHEFLRHSCISGTDDRLSSASILLNENNEDLISLLTEILNNSDLNHMNEELRNIIMSLNIPHSTIESCTSNPSRGIVVQLGSRDEYNMDIESDDQIYDKIAPEQTSATQLPNVLLSSNLDDCFTQIEITLNNLEKLKKFIKTSQGEEQLMKIIEKLKTQIAEEGKRSLSPPPHLTSSRKSKLEIYCHLCKASFTRPSSYKVHMNHVHSVDKAIFNCHKCSKTFSYENGLKAHVRNKHTREEEKIRYPCKFNSECGRVFATRNMLNMHIKRDHEKEKPFQCDQCEKSFFSKYDLKTHSRVHTGEKPYVCEFCPMSFRHSSHLFRHRRNRHKITEEKT